ncbi:MAG: alpha/beta hydrolase [Treponema sp.]|jgi:acetyl esterase/lipase|nr:alpha/beta hydrolase [Treponema sp.]
MDDESGLPEQFRNDRKKAIQKLSHLIYSPRRDPKVFREKLEEAFFSPFLPHRVEHSEFFVENVSCEMLSPQAYVKNRIIFYVHGGSFLGGSSRSWRTFCASFANECVSRLVIPNYRLAPTFAFPVALEDIQTVFRHLLNQEYATIKNDSGSIQTPKIIIAADSSGASLALALVLNLKENIRRFIKQIVLLSPWVDLSPESIFNTAKKNSDEIISSAAYKRCADLYTYVSNLKNPLVSPLYTSEQSLRDFPPVYIQMGSDEILLADVKRFCEKLKAASVPCTLDVWSGMMHLFQMADEYLTESHLAVRRVGKYVRDNTR